MTSETIEILSVDREKWWKRWLVAPVRAQLAGGSSPERLAWTIAIGIVLGIFPVMGTTTILCLLVGWMFQLNQVVIHVFKAAVYPFHLALILVFIRWGEQLYGVPLISFSIPELVGRFKDDPIRFLGDFGMAAWHGVSAWLLIAPVIAVLVRSVAAPLLRRLAITLGTKNEVHP